MSPRKDRQDRKDRTGRRRGKEPATPPVVPDLTGDLDLPGLAPRPGDLGTVPGASGDDLGTVPGASGDDLGTVPGASGDDLGTVPGASGDDLGTVPGASAGGEARRRHRRARPVPKAEYEPTPEVAEQVERRRRRKKDDAAAAAVAAPLRPGPSGTAPAPEPKRMRAFRFPALLVVFGLLVAGGVLERRVTPEASTVAAADLAGFMPTASPAGSLSSTWFCAGGTARGSTDAPPVTTTTTAKPTATTPATTPAPTTPGTTIPDAPPPTIVAEQTIIISNQGDRPQQVRITGATSEGTTASSTITVNGASRVDVPLSSVVQGAFASALVESDGGLLAVSHRVAGPAGVAVGECASEASATWYFPTGTTRLGTREIFVAYNPFPERAVLDFVFQVEEDGGLQSSRDSDKLEGLVVQPGGVLAVDITDIINVRQQIATQVHTREGVGRVVVDRLLVSDGEKDRPTGLSVTLGAPTLADTWLFADGPPIEPGIDTTFVLYNPGTETISADVAFDADGDLPEIEPYDVTVRPGQYTALPVTKDNRVPTGVGWWATVHSRLGGPLVVERVVTGAAPATRTGSVRALGSPLVAPRWLAPIGGVGAGEGEVSIVNVDGDSPITLTVSLLAGGNAVPIERFDQVSLGPAMRTVVDLGQLGAVVGTSGPDDRALRIEASGPIVVTQTLHRADPFAWSAYPLIPVRDGLSLPPADLTSRGPSSTTIVPPGSVGTLPTDFGTLPLGGEGTAPTTAPPGTAPGSVPPDQPAESTTTTAAVPVDPNAPTTVTTVPAVSTTAPAVPTTTVAPA